MKTLLKILTIRTLVPILVSGLAHWQISTLTLAQNLAPNPSFENYANCPTGLGLPVSFGGYDPVSEAIPWYRPTDASSDYFNACNGAIVGVPGNVFGSQPARTGVAYTGGYAYASFSEDFREYVQGPLSTPLIAGQTYCVELYVSLTDNSNYATDDIGVLFSDTAILTTADCQGGLRQDCGPMPYTPQINNPAGNFLTDKINWTLISGTFTAVGGESYITIGNFKDDANTDLLNVGGASASSYYYIDDVSVIPIPIPIPHRTEPHTLKPLSTRRVAFCARLGWTRARACRHLHCVGRDGLRTGG